jgi:hypothetical protein
MGDATPIRLVSRDPIPGRVEHPITAQVVSREGARVTIQYDPGQSWPAWRVVVDQSGHPHDDDAAWRVHPEDVSLLAGAAR